MKTNDKSNLTKSDNKILAKNIYNEVDSGKILLFALLIPLLLSLLFGLVAGQIASGQGVDEKQITSSLAFNAVYIACNFLAYVVLFFAYNSSRKISNNYVNFDFKLKWHGYLMLIAIGIISLFGIQFFIGGVDNLLKVIGYPVSEDLPIINPTSWGMYFLAILLLAVLPAIKEEVIFRGMIFKGLRSRFKDYQALLLSALIFALFHQNLQQLVYPFLLGMIMGWVVMRTGSLVSSIIVHFTNNFLVVTMAFIENMTGKKFGFINVWWFYLLAIALLGMTIALCYLIDKFYYKQKSKEEFVKEKKSPLMLIISLILALSLFITMIILKF